MERRKKDRRNTTRGYGVDRRSQEHFFGGPDQRKTQRRVKDRREKDRRQEKATFLAFL